jgi:hypothetical protein
VDGNAENTCNAIAPALSGDLVGGDPPSTTLLGAFDGESLAGTWVLQATDNAGGDTGTLNEWCLISGGSPSIAVDPTEVESTQAANTAITQTLQVQNVGSGLLNWSIVESGALASTAASTPGLADQANGHVAGQTAGLLAPAVPTGAGCVPSPISWLSVDPDSGSTAGGASSLVGLVFDSAGLSTGVYTGSVCISSNDLINPALTVPVTLTVEGSPVYGLSLSPDSSGSGPPGAMVIHTLTMTNTGNVADIYDLAAGGYTWATSLSASAVVLDPGASASVQVMVQIPLMASPGASDSTTITVTSRGNPGTSGMATMTTLVSASPVYLPIIAR